MAETPLKTDLILQGRVARRPIALVGTLVDGKLTQISGSVALDVSLSSILQDLGADFGEATKVLTKLVGKADIVLEKLGAAYRHGDSKSVQVGLIIGFGGSSIQFALLKSMGAQKGFIVGVDLRSEKLALPRNFLSGLIGDISISNLGVYYASEAFNEDVAFLGAEAFQDARQFTLAAPQIRGRKFPKGVKLSAEILIDGVNLLDQLEKLLSEGKQRAPEPVQDRDDAANEAEQSLDKGSTHWIETNKSIGPVSVRRIGLSYADQQIGIKLDAGLKLSVLTLTLEGLGLSYPISKFPTNAKDIWENLKFHLDGASVIFSSGPLTIGGGLIKVEVPGHPAWLQLDGFLVVRTEIFTINAIGSYADMGGTPSLFVYAALQKALGGPAYFFITGLAGGFGINRALRLPAINEVHNFPLVKAAVDPDYLAKNLDLRSISRKLGEYIFPVKGNFWIAAGIKFSSFGQIDSFAMVSVSLGTQFEIALLGMSRLCLPNLLPGKLDEKAPVIVSVEMAFKIAFSPASGVLSFEARLTENSFVLRKDFRLRGGFAFYSWFGGEHQGDFVVSIGGYHPRFKPPAHYPKPDLVEFVCKIGNAVSIRGYCYFALCPSAIMAGGGLSVVYQLGGLRAWFIAQADFLIQWRPLYYDIAVRVEIGVALRLSIGAIRISLSVELSAAVHLHGPPLGGIAKISLAIVTVQIRFGQAKRIPPPLLWESEDSEKSFAKAFLPNPKVTTITITDGLLKEIRTKDNGGDTSHTYVSPQRLILSARTLVPATGAAFNGKPRKPAGIKETQQALFEKGVYAGPVDGVMTPETREAIRSFQKAIHLRATDEDSLDGETARALGLPFWTTKLGVRPMGKKSMYSLVEVTFEPEGDSSADARKYLQQYLDISIVSQSVPRALWDAPIPQKFKYQPPKADRQMIDDALVGLEIKTKPGPRPWETPALDLDVLAYDRHPIQFQWVCPKAKQADSFPGKTISKTIMMPEVVKRRNEILTELKHELPQIMNPQDIQLDQLSRNAQYIFQDMPAMAHVGQYPPRGYLEIISG